MVQKRNSKEKREAYLKTLNTAEFENIYRKIRNGTKDLV